MTKNAFYPPTDNDWMYVLLIFLFFLVIFLFSPLIFLEEVSNKEVKTPSTELLKSYNYEISEK